MRLYIDLITKYKYISLFKKKFQTDDGGGISGRSSRGSDDDKLDRFLRSRLQRPHKPPAPVDYSANTMSTALCELYLNIFLFYNYLNIYLLYNFFCLCI